MAEYTIIGIGEILWDEFAGYKELGGAPSNFAFHAGQLGARGIIISRVGDDLKGNEIRTLLDKKKISYILPCDPDHPTGRVSVKTNEKGIPEYIIHEDSSWDFLSFDPSLALSARTADAVCFGTLAQRNPVSGKTIKKFIRATKKTCLKIFDINLRQDYYSKTMIFDLLSYADILKLNHEELIVISKMFLTRKEETACLEELISMFCLDMIVLTKGKNGSRIFVDKNNDSVYKPEAIEIIDSVGAGDSFTAVVALGLLNDFSLDRINKTANLVAAYVCSQKGATPVIPKEIIQSLN
ncbi:MAG: carbohydrate kinase [Deltaproteobacteria bacterium]|nr:carbohydrate kinase [Deltaproteobacteria bacterium]